MLKKLLSNDTAIEMLIQLGSIALAVGVAVLGAIFLGHVQPPQFF